MVKIFNGYLFVKVALTPEIQVFIEKSPNITGFPGSKINPAPLDPGSAESIVQKLKARREQPRLKFKFKIGDQVEITNGPFNSFVGEIEDINENKEEATIRVSVFGRETPVKIGLKEIKEVSE